jgi:hypothetical protein
MGSDLCKGKRCLPTAGAQRINHTAIDIRWLPKTMTCLKNNQGRWRRNLMRARYAPMLSRHPKLGLGDRTLVSDCAATQPAPPGSSSYFLHILRTISTSLPPAIRPTTAEETLPPLMFASTM